MGLKTKDVVKKCVKYGAIPLGFWFRRRGTRILNYHSVGHRDHPMNVTPEQFERQMRWLAGHAKVIPLAEAAEGKEGVAITFDDGYRDNFSHAAPILRELNLPATLFIIAGKVGGMLPHDHNPETGALMSWEEIGQLVAMNFEIGAHTLTHKRLSLLSVGDQRQEIFEGVRRIQEHIDRPIAAFAYPFGSLWDFDDTSVRLVQQAGFQYAVTDCYGVNGPAANRWALKRIWVDSSDSLLIFRAKVHGWLDVLAIQDSPLGLRFKLLLKRFRKKR